MTGFLRALRGELYAWTRRRGFRVAVSLVCAVTLLRVLGAWQGFGLTAAGEEVDSRFFNFWPRFAQGARSGLVVAEVCALVLIAGSLPRELARGALRDPLVRRISRRSLLAARGVVAVLLPIFLGAVAFLTSALSASLLFDAGHVITAPIQMFEDPEGEAAFEAWLEERDIRPDQIAAWIRLTDDGAEPDAAAAELGLEPFEFHDDFYSHAPILLFLEDEISGGIRDAVGRAALPLAVLGLFALFVSVLLPTGALASGLALGLVLLLGVFLPPELGDRAWWVFADWLPGMGADSTLENARLVADGYTDAPEASAEALATSVKGALAAAALSLLGALVIFPRKAL